MKITIISELSNGVQAWTVDVLPSDLATLCEKYDGRGVSVVDDADGIADEIRTLYKTK